MIDAVNQSGLAPAAAHALHRSAAHKSPVRPLPNLRQLLTDLAEEMAFSAAESQDYEESDVELIERGDDARRESLRQQVQELEGKYLDAYDDAEEAFRAELKRHERSPQGLKNFLEAPAEDDGINWILLERADADGTLARALGSASAAQGFLTDWLQRHEPSVRAGLNSLPQAEAARAALNTELGAVQSFYQKEVGAFHSVVGVLAAVAERFGLAQFDHAKNFIAQALAADFASAHPSRDKVRLHNIMQELQGIKSLNTIRWKLDEVVKRFSGPAPPARDALLNVFVRYLHAPSEHAAQLVALPAQAEGEQQVLFLQGLAGTVRALSPDLFADADARPRALAALQQPIDRLILEEGY